jgi:hypothetical protein
MLSLRYCLLLCWLGSPLSSLGVIVKIRFSLSLALLLNLNTSQKTREPAGDIFEIGFSKKSIMIDQLDDDGRMMIHIWLGGSCLLNINLASIFSSYSLHHLFKTSNRGVIDFLIIANNKRNFSHCNHHIVVD